MRILIYILVGLPFILLAMLTPSEPFNFDWALGWAGLATAQAVNEIFYQ